MPRKQRTKTEKLTVEQFVLRAIATLKKRPEDKGIHTVYSGFNEAFRLYFDGADPVAATKELAAAGKIHTHPTRGGAYICMPQDAEEPPSAKKTLEKMGL